MANPKDILVITTSSSDTLKIKKYLKPVSAHVVAGTNMFSDFMAGFSDVFGGRSHTYQKQLTSLYNEAVEKIKYAAYEIGANCIIGLNIDLDEISGKGKSMFMITAIGTAVIIETEEIEKNSSNDLNENVTFEKVNVLREKKVLLQKAQTGEFVLNNESWDFIILNQIKEIFPFLLDRLAEKIAEVRMYPESLPQFNIQLISYIENFDDISKLELLYDAVMKAEKNSVASHLTKIINDLNLFDYEKCMQLISDKNFNTQKLGLTIATFDKSFYNQSDIIDIQNIINFIESSFSERGERTTKKQLLSSKEIDAWNCECGKTNTENYCGTCNKDIFGFTLKESGPKETIHFLKQKISLIKELIH